MKLPKSTGRSIPNAIKHAVRQKCGFGCIFCGSPFFQYDHLDDFSDGGEHDVSNLNLLCWNHHGLKTTKKMDRAAIAKRALNPINLSKERSANGFPLEICGSAYTIDLGPAKFILNEFQHPYFPAIRIGKKDMVRINHEDGWITLDITLTDPFGRPVIEVIAGEAFISTKIWDFETVGSRVKVVPYANGYPAELRLRKGGIRIASGEFIRSNTRVRVAEDSVVMNEYLFVPGMARPQISEHHALGNVTFEDCETGVFYNKARD